MIELKKAIEILKLTPCDYEHNYKEALQTVISFLSKFQDAEMPKKKEIRPDPYGRNIIHPADEKNIYYNECYDEWLAYYTKKMVEIKNEIENLRQYIPKDPGWKDATLDQLQCYRQGAEDYLVALVNNLEKTGER